MPTHSLFNVTSFLCLKRPILALYITVSTSIITLHSARPHSTTAELKLVNYAGGNARDNTEMCEQSIVR
jgi:hypothetical protein